MFVPMSTSTGTDQHCGSPFFELNQYGVMGMEQLEYFVGVDWSSADHQVCVVDIKGKVCAQRSFKHSGGSAVSIVRPCDGIGADGRLDCANDSELAAQSGCCD